MATLVTILVSACFLVIWCKRLGDVGVWLSGGVSSQTVTDDGTQNIFSEKECNQSVIENNIDPHKGLNFQSSDTAHLFCDKQQMLIGQ